MLSLEDLRTEVTELKADVNEKVKDEKEKESTHKAALKAMEEEYKKAMDEKEHEKKDAMEKEHDKHESSYKSMYSKMKSAMEEETDEKKKEGMKASLQAMDEEHKKQARRGDMDNPEEYERKGKSAEEMKKDREHEAQITYLTAEINKPKINRLNQLYTDSKTPKNKIDEYNAVWETSTSKQLDAEITKMGYIVGDSVSTIPYEAQNSAFGFGTTSSLKKTQQFDASTISNKIDKMTDAELFSKPGGNF